MTDNPLLTPERYGRTFADVVRELEAHAREPDAREVAAGVLKWCALDVAKSRNPLQSSKDLVSRVALDVAAGRDPLPAKRRGRPSTPAFRAVQALRDRMAPDCPDASEAAHEAALRLSRPLRPAIVAELLALVRPLAANKEEAQAWVGELFNLDAERIRQILKKSR